MRRSRAEWGKAVLLGLGALLPCPTFGQSLPCAAPVLVNPARLTLRRLGAPAGDEVLRFAGTLSLAHAIDPSADGVRFILHVPFDDLPLAEPPLDATVPGGSGWTHASDRWVYRDAQGRIGGLRRIVIRQTASDTFTVVVEGRGTYPVDPSSVPPSVALVLDAASTDGCGVGRFSLSRCAFGNGTRRLACSPLPPIVPCSDPDPNALVACDARNAASVEEAYYASNGTFFAGMCSALPGFMPSPFVSCVTAETSLGYVVATAHPNATVACVWTSNPMPGEPHLVCA